VEGQSMAGLGAIGGTVLDSSGAVVSGATVTIANPQIGLQRQVTSSGAGTFLIPSLPPASGYEVLVEQPGFAPYLAREIQLNVGERVSLTVRLELSDVSQSVTVIAAAALVEPTKTGVSQVVVSEQIQNLPINGRRVDSFVLLTPGVVPDSTFGGLSFRGQPGGNAFLSDGNDTTLQFYNENGGRSRISSNVSQDAVQEFQVQTSGYTAEFGRAVGGVVNTVTRSGTNNLRGTAYWFFRNQSLSARDRYATFNPDEYRHQAGGSLGGPIRKDRLFYFANVEIMRRNFPLISSIVNPQFYSGTTYIGNCGAPATPEQCGAVETYLNRYFTTVKRTASQDLGFAKVDWRPGSRHSVTASVNLLNWESPNGLETAAVLTNAGALGRAGNASVKDRWARLSHTAIVSPNKVNELRVGWFRDLQADDPNYELAPPNGLRSALTVQGLANLGVANFLPRVQPLEDRFQIVENFSWSRGAHQFKFGFDFAHTRDTEDALFNGTGSYTYGTITDFARDLTNLDGGKRWQNYSQAFGPSVTRIFVRDYNFYAQDQWQAARNLTVSYGLRYEFAQFAQPEQANPDYPQTGRINEPRANFAPRVGAAYSFNEARTVVRAGYGIVYARFPSATIARLHQLNGTVQKSLTLQGSNAADRAAGPTFPAKLDDLDRNPPPGTVSISFADPELATPYTQQGDIGIEQRLGSNMSVTISYLWSRGFRMLTRRDLNVGPESGTFSYRINDAEGNQVGSYTTATYLAANRVDNRYSRVQLIDNGGRLWYDGLAVQFRRRGGKWVEGTIAYTLSHARDLNMGTAGSNIFLTDAPRTLANGDYLGEKGTSALHQRHRFVLAAIINPPSRDFGSPLANQALNGWQLSLITTLASSDFATPSVLVSGTPFPGAAFTTTLNGFGGSSRVPFLPQSSIPVDETYRVDARLAKQFHFADRYDLTLNFEAFNVFNRVSDTSVTTQAYQATGGVLRPLAGVGTGTASGGFPDGTNARRAQLALRFQF
jgi:hypothetical protein